MKPGEAPPPGSSVAARTSPLMQGTGNRWEIGTVVSYDSDRHAAKVKTTRGRLLNGVAQLKPSGGMFELLEKGSTVVVSWDLGFMPVILGVVDIAGYGTPASVDTDVTGTSVDTSPVLTGTGVATYRPSNAPTDLLPGDSVRQGDRGQSVSVLQGGVATLGSPRAGVQTFNLTGLLRTISQNIEAHTDFGVWKTENKDGKTSFKLRAGSDLSTETGYGQEDNWTISLDLGEDGSVFNFQINDPTKKALFQFKVDAEGHLMMYSLGGSDTVSGMGGPAIHQIDSDHTTDVSGDSSLKVAGKASRETDKSIVDRAGTDYELNAGNDASRVVNRNEVVKVGGKRTDVINDGVDTVVLDADWKLNVGDPTKGAKIPSNVSISTPTGKIETSSTLDTKMESKAIFTIKGTNVEIEGTAKVHIKGNAQVHIESPSQIKLDSFDVAAGPVGALPVLVQGSFDSLGVPVTQMPGCTNALKAG